MSVTFLLLASSSYTWANSSLCSTRSHTGSVGNCENSNWTGSTTLLSPRSLVYSNLLEKRVERRVCGHLFDRLPESVEHLFGQLINENAYNLLLVHWAEWCMVDPSHCPWIGFSPWSHYSFITVKRRRSLSPSVTRHSRFLRLPSVVINAIRLDWPTTAPALR